MAGAFCLYPSAYMSYQRRKRQITQSKAASIRIFGFNFHIRPCYDIRIQRIRVPNVGGLPNISRPIDGLP